MKRTSINGDIDPESTGLLSGHLGKGGGLYKKRLVKQETKATLIDFQRALSFIQKLEAKLSQKCTEDARTLDTIRALEILLMPRDKKIILKFFIDADKDKTISYSLDAVIKNKNGVNSTLNIITRAAQEFKNVESFVTVISERGSLKIENYGSNKVNLFGFLKEAMNIEKEKIQENEQAKEGCLNFLFN